VILDQQDKYVVNAARLGKYVEQLRQALGLGRRDCNICLVDDREIKRLNSLYLGKARATDVLSFPWNAQPRASRARARGEAARPEAESRSAKKRATLEFKNFLGDIVISVDTARRNARQEGHSTLNEIRWLILHGLLHLLGYDHEADRGEMTRLELSLRSRLGIAGD
jgi:probable rRNA maturation factor